jgi:hypothetical protein
MARMRRTDVDPDADEMRTVDSPDITKSVQEPTFHANKRRLGLTLTANESGFIYSEYGFAAPRICTECGVLRIFGEMERSR